MKHIKRIEEDKILKFSEYTPTKYNGVVLIDNIMLWLRNFENKNAIKVKLDVFLNQSKVDKDKFLTFVDEMYKTKRVEFDIKIDGDYVIFSNLLKKSDKQVWENDDKKI